MQNTFGSNLSNLRKQAGLSQEKLAEQLNVSRQAISNWERNLSEPDIKTITQIAELLDVPVSDLFPSGYTVSPFGVSQGIEFTTDGHSSDIVPKIKPTLTVISSVLALIHLVCGICSLVNIVAVVVLPVTCSFIMAIIYLSFTSMIKSNNYDMLAGYDPKKDSIKATQMQMYWCAILSGLTSIIFNVAFILVYFTPQEKQMITTTIMAFSYYAAIFVSCIAINVKIKSRQ